MGSKPQTGEQFAIGLTRALADTAGQRPSFETAFPADNSRQDAMQERVNHRSPEDQLSLLEQLTANAGAVAVDVIALTSLNDLGAAIVTLVEEMPRPSTVVAWNHPFLADIGLAEALAKVDAELVQPTVTKQAIDGDQRRQWREAAARASLGITSADYCIAETATLVMRNRPGQPRSASLLPEVHAAVISLDQIVASPGELFALMSDTASTASGAITNCMSWVSGNSKTGDIEAELVPGVHGPKRVVIYVLTGPSPPGLGTNLEG